MEGLSESVNAKISEIVERIERVSYEISAAYWQVHIGERSEVNFKEREAIFSSTLDLMLDFDHLKAFLDRINLEFGLERYRRSFELLNEGLDFPIKYLQRQPLPAAFTREYFESLLDCSQMNTPGHLNRFALVLEQSRKKHVEEVDKTRVSFIPPFTTILMLFLTRLKIVKDEIFSRRKEIIFIEEKKGTNHMENVPSKNVKPISTTLENIWLGNYPALIERLKKLKVGDDDSPIIEERNDRLYWNADLDFMGAFIAVARKYGLIPDHDNKTKYPHTKLTQFLTNTFVTKNKINGNRKVRHSNYPQKLEKIFDFLKTESRTKEAPEKW